MLAYILIGIVCVKLEFTILAYISFIAAGFGLGSIILEK